MVSIHRVSVIAYLIIRVIYFTFRFKREALHCRSLHILRLLGMALQVETRLSSKKVWKINSKLYLCIYGINDVRTISPNSTSE